MGVLDSVYKHWENNGKLTIQGNYFLGQKVGIWRYYFPNGEKQAIEIYTPNKCFIKSMWLNDNKHTQIVKNGNGNVIEFFNSGKIKKKFSVKKGIYNGIYREYTARGKVLVIGYYNNGMKDSTWTNYYYSGEQKKISHYKNDTLTGKYFELLEDGNAKVSGQYINGEKDGFWVWNKNNGRKDIEGSFSNGKMHGTWKYWFTSGELSYIANYSNDKKSGKWKYFYDGLL